MTSNIRSKVKSIGTDNRHVFEGKVSRFSYSGGKYSEKTILLKNIKMDGKLVTDHLWFKVGKFWMNCKVGDCVKFNARVKEYRKGHYHNRTSDWKLSFPTKLEIL